MFELSKQQEMKEMLGRYADGQVEMLQRAMDEWDRVSTKASERASARVQRACGSGERASAASLWIRRALVSDLLSLRSAKTAGSQV